MTLDEAIEYSEKCSKDCYNAGDFESSEWNAQLAEWLKDYKRLLEQEPCEDAISRKEVLDWIKWYGNDAVKQGYNTSIVYMWTHIRDNIPSVHPARPSGKWERHYSRPGVYADLYWHCSACGYKNGDDYANRFDNFCPHCGCQMDTDMRESEDGNADHN